MVVDRVGRAYVGNFGFEMYAGETPRSTCVIAVEPDGRAHVAAEDVGFPNGSVITPDGHTLLVGESMASRIRAFDIADDGSLSNARIWAELPRGSSVDGMCLDADGAVWLACPFTGKVLRVREGGEILEEITDLQGRAYACMLGGGDRRTLYICTAPSHEPEKTLADRTGRIEAAQVEVPGAGLP
jgi:sugar lactone lactonase YvrE